MLKVWKSEEGKKQLEKVLELLKSSKDRKEFQDKFLKIADKPPFSGLDWEALQMRLIREARYQKSPVGKLWKNLPPGNSDTQGGNMKKENENSELTPEQIAEKEKQLIAQREAGEITVEQFLSGLAEIKSELTGYWEVIFKLVSEKRTIRNTDLLPFADKLNIQGKKREHKLNAIRGILNKFVEWRALSKNGTPVYYLCNLPNFYNAEELLKIFSEEDTSRIIGPLTNGPMTTPALEQALGGGIGIHILETILKHYIEKNVIEHNKKGYKLSSAARLTNTDPAGLLALELFEAENLLDQEEEDSAKKIEISSPEDLEKIAEDDIRSKTIKTIPIQTDPKKDNLRFICFGEMRIGNQFTDYPLVNFTISEAEKIKPDVIFSSGMIQGDHRSFQVERLRALMSGPLSRISAQMKVADYYLKQFEKCAEIAVWDILGDDDWNIGKSRTLIAMKELLGLRRAGYSELLPTEVARLAGRDYVKYLKTQYEHVAPYMHRIGRTPLNKKEVNELVPGVERDEFLLILMVLLFQKFNHEIPKDFLRVVDLEALAGDKTNSKRKVSCDPVLIEWRGKKLHFIHNTGYSDVTQNLDSMLVMEKSFRQLQARGIKTPNFVFDFQQERFFGTNVGGTFMFNLAGCQNTLPAATRQLKTFNTQIVGEKSHKQNTFRKEPVSSGIHDFQIFEDGRFKFRVLNNSTMRVLENSRTVPEVNERLALFQDIQIGSPQMRLEWAIKAHDLALYGPNPVDHVSYNGDILHGFSIYMQFVSESRIKKLVSIKSQQAMFEKCFLPFYPAPTVKHIGRVLGNHEWDNLMAKKEGGDPLSFIEAALTNKYAMYNEGYKKAMLDSGFKGEIEIPYKDIEIIPYSRGRFRQSGNPEGGSTAHWPFYTRTIGGGFKYAVQHKWQPFGGGGRTPVDSQIKWVTNMAKAAGDINVMLGGHYHSFWVAMVADILMLQMPGLIDQSGLELGFGLTPLSLFCMLEFSNKDGITVEVYPMEYLIDYQCRSPYYKDKNELLVRPKPGTREFEYGFDSPLIKQWEDEVDSRHIEI